MKTLEVIEPLTEAEQIELQRLERIVAKNEVAAVNYLEALACIRNGRLYRETCPTWAEYCETKWGKSYRAINLAIQAEAVRKEVGRTSSQMSDNAALALVKVEPKKRKAVVARAEKKAGKLTPKSIAEASPRAFGAFTDKPVDTSAYTTPITASAPTPAASFGGDADEPEAVEDLPEVWDAASAEQRLNAIYERDKAWFNAVPQPLPRMILDRLIAGLHE